MHGIWRGGVFFLFFLVNIRADVPNLATRGRQSPTKQLRREALTTVLIWSSPTTRGGEENKTTEPVLLGLFMFSLFILISPLVLYVPCKHSFSIKPF